MKRGFIFLILLISAIYLLPSVQARNWTSCWSGTCSQCTDESPGVEYICCSSTTCTVLGTCGGTCPPVCSQHGVNCGSIQCQTGTTPGQMYACADVTNRVWISGGCSAYRCTARYGCNTCWNDPANRLICCEEYGSYSWRGCSTTPSCGYFPFVRSQACTLPIYSSQPTCAYPSCTCSGTGCNPANNGQRCDGCNYYSVSSVPEVCNSIDDDCDGTTDENCNMIATYWADMLENPINTTEELDKVKVVSLSETSLAGRTIEFYIYQSNTLLFDFLDWMIPDNLVYTTTSVVDSNGEAEISWTIPNIDSVTYYYSYANITTEISEHSFYLRASPIAINSNPVAVISSPEESSIFQTNQNILFNQSSYDVDDSISSYLWDFNGGTPSTSTSLGPITATYSTAGPKYISLTVTDERSASSTDTLGILIDNPLTNEPPLVIISSPESGKMYNRTVLCDATKTVDDRTPFDQLRFTWYFDNVQDPEHSNVTGIAGALFVKDFDTAGSHSIALIVDDGE